MKDKVGSVKMYSKEQMKERKKNRMMQVDKKVAERDGEERGGS